MRVVAITQARMGSTRLPGKVLLDLAGASMLERHVTRLQRTTSLTEVVVATTVQPVDDAVAALCETRGWACFRGSEDDVLDRYYQAARTYDAEIVVRVTADCPLIDPELVDRVVRLLVDGQPGLDYTSNCLPYYTYRAAWTLRRSPLQRLSVHGVRMGGQTRVNMLRLISSAIRTFSNRRESQTRLTIARCDGLLIPPPTWSLCGESSWPSMMGRSVGRQYWSYWHAIRSGVT